jgi:hypothetical protein
VTSRHPSANPARDRIGRDTGPRSFAAAATGHPDRMTLSGLEGTAAEPQPAVELTIRSVVPCEDAR